MPEQDVIQQTETPATIGSLVHDFQRVGLRRGDVVIVHSAMSKLGWVVGGAAAVIDALMKVISPGGTLVMPAHTGNNSDPAHWENPPVPQAWWSMIRTQSPPFRPEVTPTWGMGVIAELFRTYPNVLRSNHPLHSFAAWGKHAEMIIAEHVLEASMGDQSPLGKIYELDGKVLLLGVTHANNTSLHLAEQRSNYPNKQTRPEGAAVIIAGQRQWLEWESHDYDSDDFEALGEAFEASQGYQADKVALADARLVSQRKIVDFGAGWLSAHRSKQTPASHKPVSTPQPDPNPMPDEHSDVPPTDMTQISSPTPRV